MARESREKSLAVETQTARELLTLTPRWQKVLANRDKVKLYGYTVISRNISQPVCLGQ
jgi:hypothetical protein